MSTTLRISRLTLITRRTRLPYRKSALHRSNNCDDALSTPARATGLSRTRICLLRSGRKIRRHVSCRHNCNDPRNRFQISSNARRNVRTGMRINGRITRRSCLRVLADVTSNNITNPRRMRSKIRRRRYSNARGSARRRVRRRNVTRCLLYHAVIFLPRLRQSRNQQARARRDARYYKCIRRKRNSNRSQRHRYVRTISCGCTISGIMRQQNRRDCSEKCNVLFRRLTCQLDTRFTQGSLFYRPDYFVPVFSRYGVDRVLSNSGVSTQGGRFFCKRYYLSHVCGRLIC